MCDPEYFRQQKTKGATGSPPPTAPTGTPSSRAGSKDNFWLRQFAVGKGGLSKNRLIRAPAQPVDPAVLDARYRRQRQLSLLRGRASAIRTSPQGALGPATLGAPSLLGGGVTGPY